MTYKVIPLVTEVANADVIDMDASNNDRTFEITFYYSYELIIIIIMLSELLSLSSLTVVFLHRVLTPPAPD